MKPAIYDICSKPLLKRLFRSVGYIPDRVRTIDGSWRDGVTTYEVHTDLKNTFEFIDIDTALSTRDLCCVAFNQLDPYTLQIDVMFVGRVVQDDTDLGWLM